MIPGKNMNFLLRDDVNRVACMASSAPVLPFPTKLFTCNVEIVLLIKDLTRVDIKYRHL